jgi:hypothetical protein
VSGLQIKKGKIMAIVSKFAELSVKSRQRIEHTIARKVVSALLLADYAISVDNGDELVLQAPSLKKAKIMKALGSTDEDTLFVYGKNRQILGLICFVYGNDGYDLISDWTSCDQLNSIIEPILEEIESWQR